MSSPVRRRSVVFVSSPGGHLSQLQQIAAAFADDDRRWVTGRVPGLVLDDPVEFCHTPTTRNIPNLIRNFARAVRGMVASPPDLVISTGAGPAVPWFLAARLLGVPTVFLEVVDRVDSRTLTGRLVRPMSTRFLLQWPSQRLLYGRGTVVGPTYRLGRPGTAPTGLTPRSAESHNDATVLVTVGTDVHPFDRLVDWADELSNHHEVTVQSGNSRVPERAEGTSWLSSAGLADAMADADVVVCHGGPSTIAEAWAAGHCPVVVPRDPERGEHVDQHQQRYADFLAQRGLIRLVTSSDELRVAVDAALAAGRVPRTPIGAPESTVDAIAEVCSELPAVAARTRLLRRLSRAARPSDPAPPMMSGGSPPDERSKRSAQ